ncbi:exodeoxyribonuclease VII large subunit [Shewanella algae]|uniref:exodeoxyribonuclease VII large subunit n=1 Tax=Shewanella algae TaxID=38313 RepID=UPI001AAFDB98|nr:exodeoxyribonuclease VII large subunit [Shewanella algae]MBO2691567.1 exodeoxyribonuclease VII large subunit [Shewanella algae]
MPEPKKQVYTVSRLNAEVRALLEGNLGRIWLNGEISNFASPSSGHWYLTLKDNHSQIRCAMFRGRNQNVTFRPTNGQQVLVRAALSVYEPRGDYQLLIETMLPAGDGLLAQQYEALKLKLAAEGLFAADTKRPLPANIQRIGVITSPTGAAIRDVLHVLKRRDPSIEVVIYPSQVQGGTAANQLIEALTLANQRLEVDLLLLTRGGGSLEDMWCFNDENLAHAIYNSALPVISAVGHEVDTCVSDYVADLRAPTPSAAAELVSQDVDNKRQKLTTAMARLRQGWQHWHLAKRQQLSLLDHKLQRQDPKRRLEQLVQQFDEQQLRMTAAINNRLHRLEHRQLQLKSRLKAQSPAHKLSLEASRLNYLGQQLQDAMADKLKEAKARLGASAHSLESVSPLSTLSRGYSISKNEAGKVLENSQNAVVGEQMRTQLKQGALLSRIEAIIEE